MTREEMIIKAREAKSADEILALAKENGMDLTEESAKAYFEHLNKTCELSDTELENVSGGGCYTSGGKLIVTCGHSCEHWTCISCGCGLTRITVRNKDFPYGHEHAYHQDYWHYSTGYCKYKGSDDDLTCKNCKYYDYEGGVFVCNNPKRYS